MRTETFEVVLTPEQQHLDPIIHKIFFRFKLTRFLSLFIFFTIFSTVGALYLFHHSFFAQGLIAVLFYPYITIYLIYIFLKPYKPPKRLKFFVKNHEVVMIMQDDKNLFHSKNPAQDAFYFSTVYAVVVKVVNRLPCVLTFKFIKWNSMSRFWLTHFPHLLHFSSFPVQLPYYECDKFFKLLNEVKNVKYIDNDVIVFLEPISWRNEYYKEF